MAAQLDHADKRDRPCTAMGCCVLSEEHTFSDEQKEMHVECRSGVNGRPRHGGTRWLESDLERQASSWTTNRCVEVKQRAVLPRRRSRNAEQRVTLSEEEGEATSDALCEGGVSGDSSRTLRGTAAVKHRSEIHECSATQREKQPGLGTREPMSKQPRTGTQEPLERKDHGLTARHKCATRHRW